MATQQRSTSGPSPAHPELSILVSCFNQAEVLEPALRECLKSVGKLVPSFETLIINDGSTDGSIRILDRLRKEFPSVRVTHQLHSGRARAIRRGYDLARGLHVFQIDLNEPGWVADFPRFWAMRDRYALILGHHPHRGNRLRRTLQWIQARWVKLWFGAELIEPDATYRLCRRDIALHYLQQIPKDYEGVDLGMTLTAYRDSPRLLLEVEVGTHRPRARVSASEQIARLIHYFSEIAGLRFRRVSLPTLKPAPQSA